LFSQIESEDVRPARPTAGKPKTADVSPQKDAASNQPPRITSVYPEESSISDLQVGGSILFVITAHDPDSYAYLAYEWYVDGFMNGTGTSFMYAPATAGDVGVHEVEVKVSDGSTTISREWSITVRNFIIEVDAGEHGSISPSGDASGAVSVAPDSDIEFTITPQECHGIEEVLVDGDLVGAVSTYRFAKVRDDHAIAANFAPLAAFTVTAEPRENGSISPSGPVKVDCKGNVTFTITAHPNYEVEDVLVDGVSVGAVSTYTFSGVRANHTIAATFIKAPVIEVLPGKHGSISPSGRVKVPYLSDQTFAVSPDLGYIISDVLVDGDSVGGVESYTFQTVSENHTLTAVFMPNEPPVADAGPDQQVEPGAEVLLSASNSTDPDDGIVSYLWEQTGGSAVTLSDPKAVQPTFFAPTSGGEALTFKLTVTDKSGMQARDTSIVNIVQDKLPPVAVAGFEQTVNEGETVVLDGSGSYDFEDGIGSYQWEQLDGSAVALSDPAAVQPTFKVKGIEREENSSLLFRLTVTDRSGLKSSDYCIVNVSSEGHPPTAAVGPDQNGLEGETLSLDGSKSSASDSGRIVSYRWKQVMGPPVALTAPEESVTSFVAPRVGSEGRSLTFLLIVTDEAGLRASSTSTVFISPPLVLTSPNGSETWRAGNTYTISWNFKEKGGRRPDVALELLKSDSAVSVITPGIPIGTDGTGSFEWTIPAGSESGDDYRIRVFSRSSASERAAVSGSEIAGSEEPRGSNPDTIVYMDVSDNPFTIAEPAPVADFSASPVRGAPPLEVRFTDSSSGTITNRLWDFGDGVTSDEKDPVHTYGSSGAYTVTLKVEGPGGSHTEIKPDLINPGHQPPMAAFSAPKRNGTVPLKVDFKDESEGSITSWYWDFGDGETSDERNPTHTYRSPGVYEVSLSVEGPGGPDTQTIADYVSVEPAPLDAAFRAAPTRGAAPLEVTFTDMSKGDIAGWSWEFGDGATSDEQNPTHTYATPGTYSVKLTISGPTGEHAQIKAKYISVLRPSKDRVQSRKNVR
jgi:PKD repeat protein